MSFTQSWSNSSGVLKKLTILLVACSASSNAHDNQFNFVQNEQRSDEEIDLKSSQSPHWNMLENLSRNLKFDKPPKSLQNELLQDSIVDCWEQSKTCEEECDDPFRDFESEMSKQCARENYQPIIGILTQPVFDSKKEEFNYKDYILEINDNFVKWAGSRTVAIPYNIPEDELMNLLPQINGILFTGGALDLISNTTGAQHPYYVTAKKIFQYNKFMKDVKGEEWPILGICQGLELVSILMNDDQADTLDYIDIYGKSLPIDWAVENVSNDSRLFQTFPDHLVEAMDQKGLALHAHTYSISMETFNASPGLKENMKVTQTDIWTRNYDGKDVEFITAMEGTHYPIFCTMYHPEYQLLDYLGSNKWGNDYEQDTQEIAFRISLVLNRYGRMNNNRVAPQNEVFFNQMMRINRIPAQPYPMVGLIVYAFGYQEHYTVPDFKAGQEILITN